MILDSIVKHKQLQVTQQKAKTPLAQLLEQTKYLDAPRDFAQAISKNAPSIIAEIKRHSPSRGPIWEDLIPNELAGRYEQSGASAISVLTDEKYFHGQINDLTQARQSVSIPCLRKEFIIDEYQIYESRVGLADTILLIVRILEVTQLKDYIALSRELGMEPLVEVHTEKEVEVALEAKAKIIGINNRDLDTLQIDVGNTVRLKKMIPEGYIVVSESGISRPETIKELFELGINAFLIGESILLNRNPEQFIPWLLGK